MSYRPQRHFGAKQPPAADARAQLARIIASARDIAALDAMDHVRLARMYREDPRQVECMIGAARRRLSQ